VNGPCRLLSACMLAGALLVARPAVAEPTKNECIAAINSGEDLRQAGKLLAARERFGICVATSCPDTLREDCGQRLGDVIKATPTLVFEAKDVAGNDLSAVRVTMDGQPFADHLDSTAVAVDPGLHRFVFETDGVSAVEKALLVREGDKDRHEKVVLGMPPPEKVTQPTGMLPTMLPTSEPGTGRTTGIILGGIGGVGLLVGAVSGGLALWVTQPKLGPGGPDGCYSNNQCPNGSAQARSDVGTLKAEEILADVGFGVGAVGLALGAAFFFSSGGAKVPRGAAISPFVGPGGLGLTGRFR